MIPFSVLVGHRYAVEFDYGINCLGNFSTKIEILLFSFF